MTKLFTITTFYLLVACFTFIVSCTTKSNLFGFKPKPIVVDCAVMHQLNENGDLMEVLDTAVNGYTINYELRGDTLLGHFDKNDDKFEWYGLFEFKLRNKYCDICDSYLFTAKNNSNIIFHIKEKKVIAVEMRNNYENVIFKSE
jgi:hypothetical protein